MTSDTITSALSKQENRTEQHQKVSYTLQQQNTVILPSLDEKLGNDTAHICSYPTSKSPPSSISQQNVILSGRSDEQDALQIKAGNFLDSDYSEMEFESGGEDKESAGNEHLINERVLPVQFCMANEFGRTKPYLHSDEQSDLKLSCMQQKVCDDTLFSKECAFQEDDLMSLPVVHVHIMYFKTSKYNDSLVFYLAQMREKAR